MQYPEHYLTLYMQHETYYSYFILHLAFYFNFFDLIFQHNFSISLFNYFKYSSVYRYIIVLDWYLFYSMEVFKNIHVLAS